MYKHGLTVVASAGNEAKDSCKKSPSASCHVITVGGINTDFIVNAYSDYGPCIDVYSPGTGIRTASASGGSEERSGGSMAAPHVSGIIALLIADGLVSSPEDAFDFVKRKLSLSSLVRIPPHFKTDNNLKAITLDLVKQQLNKNR